jgi:hypothetical protein
LGRQSQARKFQRVKEAPVLSNCHGPAGDRTVTSQCPSKTLSPSRGQSVGGVSERAGAKAEGSNPFARTNSFACRGGERHPDLLEGGALRGATSERGSWSVRSRVVVSPTASRCADDRGCPKGAEEGNVVSMRHKAHAPREAREIAHHLGTRPSLGPEARARQSSLHTTAQATVVGRTREHHGWANLGNQG